MNESKLVDVFILEDRRNFRQLLSIMFQSKGLTVAAAANAEEARSLMGGLEGVKVAILDMTLEKEQEQPSQQTGADIALEFKTRFPHTEYLIYSAYTFNQYLKKGFALGAVDYLDKGETAPEQVVSIVMVLLAKYELKLADRNLWLQSLSLTISRFSLFQHVLEQHMLPLLQTRIQSPLVLLLTDGEQQTIISSQEGNPTPTVEFLTTLCSLLQLQEQLCIQDLNLPEDVPPYLQSSCFAKLFQSGPLVLALGVLNQNKDEEPAILLTTCRHHLPPVISEAIIFLQNAQDRFRTSEAAQLESATNLCSSLAIFIKEALIQVRRDGDLASLDSFATELYQMGDALARFPIAPKPTKPNTELAPAIYRCWQNLTESWPGIPPLQGNSSGQVCVPAADLDQILREVLLWFLFRNRNQSNTMYLACNCRERGPNLEIGIQDRSRRMPALLRGELFTPFNFTMGLEATHHPRPRLLGLYFARKLAEDYGGMLIDQTESLEGEGGNRLLLVLPRPGQATGGEQ